MAQMGQTAPRGHSSKESAFPPDSRRDAKRCPLQLRANNGRGRQNHHSRQGEADQDRRIDHQPWPLCRVPDGGARHSSKSVRGHLAHDCGAATAALGVDCVKRSLVKSSIQTTGEAPEDRQIGYFLCHHGGFGPVSDIRCSSGARGRAIGCPFGCLNRAGFAGGRNS